jgi:hypothetical protein
MAACSLIFEVVIQAMRIQGPAPYGQRQNFFPRKVEDFGDGGAFPEIHYAQFPLNMGESTIACQ